jgi:predicted nuclease with TOPRIM domain
MKKIILLALLFCIIPIKIYCNEYLEYHKVTKEELKGVIEIPNREGKKDVYKNIDTYEDLYEVLEDLSNSYAKLLEEHNSLENDYKELQDEQEKTESELKEIKEENRIKYNNDRSDKKTIKIVIITSMLILIFLILYTYVKKKK